MPKPSLDWRKSFSRAGLTAFLILFVAAGAGGGFMVGRRYERSSIGVPPEYVSNATNPSGEKVDFGLFWQAWNIVSSKHFGGTDPQKQVDGAISGMLGSLDDPYTVYLEPSVDSVFRSDLEGSFGGIGAELNVKDGQLVVVSALEGTPAERAGLKGGDVIALIDGQKTEEISFNDAVNKIRGEKGSEVTLTIVRDGGEAFEQKIVRDTITVKSVKTENIGENGSVAYIKINQFGQDTADGLRAALQEAKSSGKTGVIIDLRDNPGGYLDSAVETVGMVIPSTIDSSEERLRDRVAVVEKTKDGKEQVERTTEKPVWDTGKLVVLVNEGSASASEIFAGALKDYGRAKLVGTKTFGKGSVQELQDLDNGGSIKVTVAKWFTPLGTGIDGIGIEPDEKVELPDGVEKSSTDAQVSKALELVK